jgi:glycyl-tRNA synthetase
VEHVAAAQPIPVSGEVQGEVIDFIVGRLDVLLHEQGWPHDVIAAVLAEQGHNPARAMQGVSELAQWLQREDWPLILDNYARCVRITRTEARTYSVDPALFETGVERDLYAACQSAAAQVGDQGGVDDFLAAFEPIVPVIQRFFEEVLVMAEDRAVRENRLGLLQAITALARGRADLSRMAGF